MYFSKNLMVLFSGSLSGSKYVSCGFFHDLWISFTACVDLGFTYGFAFLPVPSLRVETFFLDLRISFIACGGAGTFLRKSSLYHVKNKKLKLSQLEFSSMHLSNFYPSVFDGDDDCLSPVVDVHFL